LIARLVSFFGATHRKPHGAAIQTPLLITRPSPNPESGCTPCICSRGNCRTYRASDSHTCASGYSWHAGSRSAASRWISWRLFCRREPPIRSAVPRNSECVRLLWPRFYTKNVVAAKVFENGKGSRQEYSRWTSESNGQGRKANGRCKVRLRTTITGSLYHSVLFNGT
jgi:hypothetical protein